jgi:hypothetical protein
LFNNLFSLPAYFVIFSDEFKFTYKTVSSSQTKHLAAPFPMMLLNLLLCVVQILRLLALTMACAKGCRENFSSGSTGSFWRLVPFGKHQKRLGSISDGSSFV